MLEHLFGSARALEAAERDLRTKLQERGILFGDGLLPTFAWAFVAPRERLESWASSAEKLVGAAEELATRLVHDTALYDAMGLSRDMLDLVRIDPGYRRTCVLCRPDGIPVGNQVRFVELNCDSPAMMMFLDMVGRCVLELDAFAPLRERFVPSSAADRLLDALLACHRELGGPTTPNIAITDWEGQKTRYEHQRLAEHFTARGYPTVVCDPRAFRREGGALHVKDRRIDLVYRRALGAELIARRGEVEALLGAYRDHTVCMVNPLHSFLAGVKAVLTQLGRDGHEAVPRTLLLETEEARAAVAASPTRWALKKSESHGGEGVVLPGQPGWANALELARREVWIAQEYQDVPRIALPVADGDAVGRAEKYFNWNPFVFGGSYAGGLVRFSATPLINITLGGGLLPTFAA